MIRIFNMPPESKWRWLCLVPGIDYEEKYSYLRIDLVFTVLFVLCVYLIWGR
jgi:hypothetical protein